MIRTHILECHLPRSEADALNRESGRVYTDTLVWHYRIYRRTGHWLSQGAAEKLNDSLSPTTLHAHSRDAAQQAFYKACKTAKATRAEGGKYPHKRKFYRTTSWKATGIRAKDGRLLLARARGLEPVAVALPSDLTTLPKTAFVEMRLVYDLIAKRHRWHLVVDDGVETPLRSEGRTLAADLGEIHPAAIANEAGDVVIFTARDLRALNQYRNKRLASLQTRQSRHTKKSRRWKKMQRRKTYLLARNNRQRRDIEHKVTRAITNHAKAEGTKRLVVGDIRDIANGKRLNRNAQQKVSGWSHGRQIAFLVYKLAAEGIALERQSEAYSSKTCPVCGRHNKPKGRNYRCARCGFVGHRDAVGAVNQESQAVHGAFGHVQVGSVKYRRAFVRRSSPDTGHVAREAHPADGSREAAGL
ncbi:IS200/IS605 family element transposase accessory protein TnpB [Chloroflexales bacterium ZM16-3]|nr:IS200/IS605 family element transposase accessory protein TnpB [Chloroflexales bacterium ZM16-3]